jgi:pimeloyl-ACP methyl ester carboxylesterase
MRIERVPVGDVTLEVASAGSGGRPLLLVHGFTGGKSDFTDWLDPLAERGWHAAAPDLRGHGGSEQPEAEDAYSLVRFAADLDALADALGWTRLVLLGHSMGGMVAQVFALQPSGARLDGLVLMDTSHGRPDGLDPDLVETGASIVRDGGIPLLADVLRKAGPDPLATEADQRLRRERPGYAEFMDGKLLASSPAMWLAMTQEMVHGDDRLERLRQLRIPTLVMAGEQDAAFIGHSRRMAAAIPTSTLAVIPGGGHCPQFEATDEWWSALASFLDTLPHPVL